MALAQNTSEFLNVKELSKKLVVPINTIYYWVSKNEIPYIKMGKHNRFIYQEVLDFFRTKTANKNQLNKES